MATTKPSQTSSRPQGSSSITTGARANATASDAHDATTRGSGTRGSAASQSSLSKVPSHGTATTQPADGTTELSRTLSEQHVRALESRGLDPEVAVRLGLYSEPGKFGGRDGRKADALVFPYVREGVVINRKYRGPGKKFLKDPGAPSSFWNEDALRDSTLAKMPALVLEGEFDAYTAIQCDLPRTVSVPDGADSNLDFMVDIWSLLDTVPRFVLGGDGDEAGRRLNAELARRFGAARCAWLDYPQGTKDLNEVLKAHGEAGVRAVVENARPYPIRGLFKLADYPPVPQVETFSTGWINLNQHLKLWPSELLVITGIPTHGKSTWALNLAAQIAEAYDHNWCIASFEMRIEPYVANVLRRYHGGDREEANKWINERFVFIDEDPTSFERMDLEWIIEKASDAVIRYGIKWLLLDPWNQIQHSRKKGEDKVEYQERALAELKRFARAFECGVAIVVHPTKDVRDPRNGKTRTPGLYDIDGSAHWYNAADHGVVIERPEITHSLAKVYVKKSRYEQGGVPGEACLRYDRRTGRYTPAVADAAPSNEGKELL